LEISTQCRPTLLDNLPAVRFTAPRTIQINGLYRHGFLIAPAMLDVVMELIQNGHGNLADQFNLRVELPAAAAA
jgi:glycine oxidase